MLVASGRTAGHLHQPLASALRATLTPKKAQTTVFFLRSACAFDVAGIDNPQHDSTFEKSSGYVTSRLIGN